jgi:ribose/xylose/arabinose/galactoside ABC-type transport system permease subunit
MMFQLPELGLLSLAMPIPLISGGLNLAIIATANQAALLMAWILTTQMPGPEDKVGGSILQLLNSCNSCNSFPRSPPRRGNDSGNRVKNEPCP